MKTILNFAFIFFCSTYLFGQSKCTPISEVNFPGGRVIMSFDGNVHDDDDIVALPYSMGLWWAAGLKNKVVQVEYNNHVCSINATETDGTGPGSGDDSKNMVNSVNGSISRFGYSSSIFYNYETKGSASTSKMASEIEKSTSSNPLWIIAAGPMETIWRALEKADKGFNNVTIISHSQWNEDHKHCSGSHNWSNIKNKYKSKGVYFVGSCSASGVSCSSKDRLYDQNGGFASPISNWTWMKNSNKEYNRWIFSRNPFGFKFDPSDAGMSYYLITGGPFKGGEKRADHNDAKKLMENPCTGSTTSKNAAPTVNFTAPKNGDEVLTGSTVTVKISADDSDGKIIKHQVYYDGKLVDTDGTSYSAYKIVGIKSGSHDIRVKVTDDDGATASRTITITANSNPDDKPSTGNSSPTISFKSPTNNSTVKVGSTVIVDLATSDDGKIVKHRIFVNNVLKDTDGSSYTPHKIKNISKGTYKIEAKVTDDKGATTTKSVTITAGNNTSGGGDTPSDDEDSSSGNKAPTITFISPTNKSTVQAGTTVTINIKASDSDGSIVKHQIVVNDILKDTDGSKYSPHKITNISAGTHKIKARVFDNDGAKTLKTIYITAVKGTQKESRTPGKGGAVSDPTDDLTITLPEDVASVDTAPFLRIDQNPVKEGILRISQNSNNLLQVVNMSGEVVRSMKVDSSEMEVDVSGLRTGLYFVITDKMTAKFIVE